MVARKQILTLALILIAVGLQAGTFVSFNGKFHITYPDSWEQVDFHTAEFYLSRGDTTVDVDFEAAFAERAAVGLFRGQYLILTADTLGELSAAGIDSVLGNMASSLQKEIRTVDSSGILNDADLENIVYWPEGGLASVETEVAGDDLGARSNLLVMKFHEHGIANFYFYAPSHEIGASRPVYRQMVNSLSTRDMEAALDEGPVKVADIEDGSGWGGSYLVMFAGLAMLLIIILASRLRGRRKKS